MMRPLVQGEEFWKFGEAYEKTARGGSLKPHVFTPEILYNICGMAIESYFMGWLFEHHHLPENHTLRDLVRAAEKLQPVPAELKTRLHKMDGFQEICSLITLVRRTPTTLDVQEFLSLVSSCRSWLEQQFSAGTRQSRG